MTIVDQTYDPFGTHIQKKLGKVFEMLLIDNFDDVIFKLRIGWQMGTDVKHADVYSHT